MDPLYIIGPAVSLVLLILLYLMISKSRRMKTNIPWIFGSISCVALGNIFTLMPDQILASVGQILLSLGIVFLFYHYESVANNTPNQVLNGIVIALFSASTSFIIVLMTLLSQNVITTDFSVFLSPLNVDYGVLALQFSLISFFYLQTIMSLVILVRGIYIVVKITQNAKILATKLELVALVLISIYKLLFIPRYFLSSNDWLQISSIALFFSIIGIITLISNYILHADYLYALPFPIHKFLFYNKNGLLCYTRKVEQNASEMEEKDILISGTFSAISALIQETLGKNAQIQHINAQQYQVNFCPLPRECGNLVVIAYGDTALFTKSLKRFTELIPEKILEIINSDVVQLNLIEGPVDEMIRKYFPYVKFTLG